MHVVSIGIVRRGAALAIALSLVPGLMAAPAALAVGSTASVTTLSAPTLNPKPVGETASLTAKVSDGATGDVEFKDNDVPVATVALDGAFEATYTVPAGASPGTHVIKAEYQGDATFAPSQAERNVEVGPRPVTVTLSLSSPHDATGATVRRGETLRATFAVADNGRTGSLPVSGGTVKINVDGAEKATITLPTDFADLDTAAWAPGTRSVVATFNPGTAADHSAGTSTSKKVFVAMASASVQYTTFYPTRDGYKDTVALRGVRYQSESVSIKVVSPGGKTVKTASVAAGTGAWSVPWNGRNSAGTMLAAGKYKVLSTVTKGTTKQTLTTYVTLSGKRLVTLTKTLTQSIDQRDFAGTGWAGWQFTLPAATVYKKVVFAVNAKSNRPLGRFGPQDYTKCTSAFVGPGCASPTASLPTSRAWKSVTGSVSKNRSGAKARLFIWRNAGSVWVWSGRVTVTYGVLK